jgi:hypothetical protein
MGLKMGLVLRYIPLLVLTLSRYQQAYHTLKLWGSCGALHSLLQEELLSISLREHLRTLVKFLKSSPYFPNYS